MFRTNRRHATRLILSAAATSVFAGRPAPAQSRRFEERLRRDLAGIALPHSGARLDLVRLTQGVTRGRIDFRAVVRMTWPPGLRQRVVWRRNADPERAYADLVAGIRAQFPQVL